MEVLNPADVVQETAGMVVDGLKIYPRAVPIKMLRIFRRRFKDLAGAMEEIRRVKTIEAYLFPDHIAQPEEFLVDYLGTGKREILLAGLQEYVSGEVLEPWGDLENGYLYSLLDRMGMDDGPDLTSSRDRWIGEIQKRAVRFITKVRELMMEARLVPDLAGVGNLLLTRTGNIKLVDINNISEITSDPGIPLDDRGYPVCDKSISVIIHLEQRLAGKSPKRDDPVYAPFLNPERLEKVKAAEKEFYLQTTPTSPTTAQV